MRGRDIKRNGYEFAGLYLIATHNGYIKEDGTTVPKIRIDDYPAVKRWLGSEKWNDKPDKGTSIERLSNRTDKGDTFYNLRDCAYMDDFSQQRFIWTAVNSEYRFLAVNQEIYYNNSIFHGLSNKSSGIASIMNSKIMRYYLILVSSERYQYGGKEMMQNIPIPPKIENITYSEDDIRKFYHLSDEEIKYISSSVRL